MTTALFFVIAGSFLASAVEMVEAMTIVLAMGVTRGWRSTLIGAASALAVLALIIVTLGPLIENIPFSILRIVVGGLLLVFGLQWLRKAVLRYSHFKAMHDEAATYRKEVEESERAGTEVRAGLDWYAFTISFKGVLLEGLEVAFIVLTFGTSHGNVAASAIGAIAGVLVVGIVAVMVQAPLSRVPENTMKYWVGVTLTTFGTFWSGEGLKVEWPGEDLALLWIFPLLVAISYLLIRLLDRRYDQKMRAMPVASAEA